MRILAIDTSTSWCSVALCFDDQPIVHRHEILGSKASQHLLPWCSELLQQLGAGFKDLDALAVGVGPGAFTGVRLSVAVAQGLSTGLQFPVIPVTSLDAMALQFVEHYQTPQNTTFTMALDARMGEVYWARYQRNETQPNPLHPIQLTVPAEIPDNGEDLIAGNALAEYADYFANHFVGRQFDAQLVPNALSILDLAKDRYQVGQVISVERLEPLYIRNKVALTTQERNEPQAVPQPVICLAELVLELMTEPDLDTVMAIEANSHRHPWSRGNFIDSIQAGHWAYCLREVSDPSKRIWAYCILLPAVDDLHLLNITVDTDLRGKGVGLRLMSAIQAIASNLSIPRILLEVRPSNEAAIALYEKAGYEELARRKAYYPVESSSGIREDAIVMVKNIDSSVKPYAH